MAFNINAQVILSGPKNLSSITSSIKKQLGSVTVGVNVQVPKNVQKQIQNLNSQLSTATATTNKLNSAAKTTGNSLNKMGRSAKDSSNAMQQLGKETALTFKRFAAAGIVTATFFRLTRAISEAVPKALEFQRELVKIQQVTGQTQKQLAGLSSSIDTVSRSLGIDANELANIARIFAQTGQSLDQVEASLKAVARSSLAPTFGTMEQTAEGLIAAMAQFGIEANQAEAVLGSLNQVAKKFAVESGDLISAVRRAGGVFALAATDAEKPIDALNQLVGVFTAVRSTTRESAETIATGLRTIFTRIQRRGTIDAMKELGINLTDAQGNFVGLFSSFRILSKELDGIIQKGDAVTLSAITEELGGIRQVGKLIPAIRDFRKAEAAFAEAQKGAAEGLGKDVLLGLEPLAKGFERVQVRFESLIRTISESATFNALAKTALGLANAFLQIAENLTAVLPAITAFAGIKLAKGAIGFGKGFFGSFGAGGGVGGAGAALGGAATGANAKIQASSSKILATATNALNVTNKALLSSNQAQTATTKALTLQVQSLQAAVVALTTSNKLVASSNNRAGIGGIRRGGRRRGFATGGLVPGQGNGDTVKANLTPGEFVLRKSAVNSIGADTLEGMNRQGFQNGGTVPRRKSKNAPKVVGSITGPFGLGVLNKKEGTPKNLGIKDVLISDIEREGGPVARELINKVLKSSGLSRSDLGRGPRLTAPRGRFSSLRPKGKVIFKEEIIEGIPSLFNSALKGLGLPLGSKEKVPFSDLISKGNLNSVTGNFFESFVRRATSQTITDDSGPDPLFDFESVPREIIKKLFGSARFPLEIKVNDEEAQLASTFGKRIKQSGGGVSFLPGLKKQNKGLKISAAGLLKKAKLNSGGPISGNDTVPALLTPGEFVVNKKAAGKIGLSNLEGMNKFAKGGPVPGAPIQKFQLGGQVANVGNIGNIGFILSALGLVPEEIEGLVNSISLASITLQGFGVNIGSLLSKLKGVDIKGIQSLGPTLKNFASNLKGQIPVVGKLGQVQKNLVNAQKFALSQQRKLTGAQNALTKAFAQLDEAKLFKGFSGGQEAISKFTNKVFQIEKQVAKQTVSVAQANNSVIGFSKSAKAGTKLIKGFSKGIAGIVATLLADPIGNAVTSLTRHLNGLGEEIALGTKGIRGTRGASVTDVGSAAALGGGVSGAIEGAALGAALGGPFAPFTAALGAATGAIIGFISAGKKAVLAQDEFNKTLDAQDAVSALKESLVGLSKTANLTSGQLLLLTGGVIRQGKAVDTAIEASVRQSTDTALFSRTGPSQLASEAGLDAALGNRVDQTEGFFNTIFTGLDTTFSRVVSVFSSTATEGLKELAREQQTKDIGASVEKQREVLGADLGAGAAAEAANKALDSSLKKLNTTSLRAVNQSRNLGDSLNITTQGLSDSEKATLKSSLATARASELRLELANRAKLGDKVAQRSQRAFEILQSAAGGAGRLAELSAEQLETLKEEVGLTSAQEIAYADAIGQALFNKKRQQQEEIESASLSLIVANEAANAANKLDALAAAMVELGNGSSFASEQLGTFLSNIQAQAQAALAGKGTVRATQEVNPFANIGGATEEAIQKGFSRIRSFPGGDQLTQGLDTTIQFQKQLPTIFRDIVGKAGEEGGFESPEALTKAVQDAFPDFDKLPQEIKDSLTTSIKTLGRQGDISSQAGIRNVLQSGEVDKALGSAAQKAAEGLAKFLDALGNANNVLVQRAELLRQVSERETQGKLKSLEIAQRADSALDEFRQKSQFTTNNLAQASEKFGNRLEVLGVTRGTSAAQLGADLTAERKTTAVVKEIGRDALASGDFDKLFPGAERAAESQSVAFLGIKTPGVKDVSDPAQRRAQAKAATDNLKLLTNTFQSLEVQPNFGGISIKEQAAILGAIESQRDILTEISQADGILSDPVTALDNLNQSLSASVNTENNMLQALTEMRDDTSLIAAAQEDLKSLQRLQLSAGQTAKADLEELGRIQRETDPGKKASLIQDRQNRKGFTALRKIQAGEELDLTDLGNLLNNLDELGSTDFALQNPKLFQNFVNQAQALSGQGAAAGGAQLGEPTRKIGFGLLGQDLTQTSQAQALAQIEAEQQAANDALTQDAVVQVQSAAVKMLAAAEAAMSALEDVVGRANILRGLGGANPPALPPLAPPPAPFVPLRQQRPPQVMNPQFAPPPNAVPTNFPGLDIPGGGGFQSVEDRIRLSEKRRPRGDISDRVTTGGIRAGRGIGGSLDSAIAGAGQIGPELATKLNEIKDGIDLNANIGDFQINLMGTENAVGQIQRAVVNVALEQIKEQLPALIEEQQNKIKSQV